LPKCNLPICRRTRIIISTGLDKGRERKDGIKRMMAEMLDGERWRRKDGTRENEERAQIIIER
jgi:hypothetical protein